MDLINVLEISQEAFSALCGDTAGGVIMDVVDKIITIIQIIVPILLIIFGSIDLAKAVMAGKEDEIKKSQMTFVKRAIAAVIVFFVPFVVRILMDVLEVNTSPCLECIIDTKNC